MINTILRTFCHPIRVELVLGWCAACVAFSQWESFFTMLTIFLASWGAYIGFLRYGLSKCDCVAGYYGGNHSFSCRTYEIIDGREATSWRP